MGSGWESVVQWLIEAVDKSVSQKTDNDPDITNEL